MRVKDQNSKVPYVVENQDLSLRAMEQIYLASPQSRRTQSCRLVALERREPASPAVAIGWEWNFAVNQRAGGAVLYFFDEERVRE